MNFRTYVPGQIDPTGDRRAPKPVVVPNRFCEEANLLTESEIQRSFRRMFSNTDVDEGSFEKAEALLEELRPESPLRHRLAVELDELRTIFATKS